jgi:hypothetical protein
MHVYHANSPAQIVKAAARAGIAIERIVETVETAVEAVCPRDETTGVRELGDLFGSLGWRAMQYDPDHDQPDRHQEETEESEWREE